MKDQLVCYPAYLEELEQHVLLARVGAEIVQSQNDRILIINFKILQIRIVIHKIRTRSHFINNFLSKLRINNLKWILWSTKKSKKINYQELIGAALGQREDELGQVLRAGLKSVEEMLIGVQLLTALPLQSLQTSGQSWRIAAWLKKKNIQNCKKITLTVIRRYSGIIDDSINIESRVFIIFR